MAAGLASLRQSGGWLGREALKHLSHTLPPRSTTPFKKVQIPRGAASSVVLWLDPPGSDYTALIGWTVRTGGGVGTTPGRWAGRWWASCGAGSGGHQGSQTAISLAYSTMLTVTASKRLGTDQTFYTHFKDLQMERNALKSFCIFVFLCIAKYCMLRFKSFCCLVPCAI